MLSWVSDSIQKSQQQKTPLWFENEVGSQPFRRSNNIGNRLIPKLRWAFEVATNSASSNGSFPVHDPIPPPRAVPEETAFDACDSVSHCQSQTSASGLSYNMSRIDDDDDNMTMSCVDSFASPCNSDADSFFGRSIRDIVQVEIATEKDRDDVWLLSPKIANPNQLAASPQHAPFHNALRSPTGSIRSRVPVLLLPADCSTVPHSWHHKARPVRLPWGDEQDAEEEEIQFDDDCLLIENKRVQLRASPKQFGHEFDENRNAGNVIARLTLGRKRAHMIGKNLKEMVWSSSPATDSRKRGKASRSEAPKPITHKTKRKQPPLKSHLHSEDPLKELSRCHEKMSQNQRPFSPSSTFNRWNRRDSGSLDGQKGGNYQLHGLDSTDPAFMSSLSAPASSSIQHDNGDPMTTNLGSVSEEGKDLFVSNTMSVRDSELKEPTMATKFKIRFRSPRNDTPRIVLGHTSQVEVAGEPRVLYTSEGTVEAFVHPHDPEPQHHDGSNGYGGFLTSMESKSSFNYDVFHSELSTLYEVSSSLESASFGTYSGTAESEEAMRNRAQVTGPRSLLGSMSSSTSGSISKQKCMPDSFQRPYRKDSSSTKSKGCSSPRSQFDSTADTRSSSSVSGASAVDPFLAADREIKMRWAYSLWMGEKGAGQWRQPVMGLMNTEELSNNYIAEI